MPVLYFKRHGGSLYNFIGTGSVCQGLSQHLWKNISPDNIKIRKPEGPNGILLPVDHKMINIPLFKAINQNDFLNRIYNPKILNTGNHISIQPIHHISRAGVGGEDFLCNKSRVCILLQSIQTQLNLLTLMQISVCDVRIPEYPDPQR